ncbi:MAG: hypothetical protein WBF71_06380 [Microthrixaceae bacterium]
MIPDPRRRAHRPEVGFDVDTPFGRLALTHILSLGGDALVALVLAGSLFFSIDPSGARWRIALYLVFTMAPFALVGPLIGPAMDKAKGGRRLMLVLSTVGRAVVALLLIASVTSESLWLFPEAFLLLVLSKSYAVAKAAVIPTVVSSDEGLVEANSKLQVLGGLAAFAAGAPGALILWLAGPGAVAFFCALVFAAASIASLRVPVTVVAADAEDDTERAELRSAGVLSAATAMGSLRWIVGFITFLLAFALRGDDTRPGAGVALGHMLHDPSGKLDLDKVTAPGAPPVWHFGVVIALTGIGGLVGASVAPMVRRHFREEYLLIAAMVIAASSGLVALLVGGLLGMSTLAFGIAVASSAGKQAFDAVVQRDAPAANRGRSFARFESRFQVVWVFGAALPVVVTVPTAFGAAVVMAVAASATAFYTVALRAVDRGESPPHLPSSKVIGGSVRSAVKKMRQPDGTRPEGAGPGVAETEPGDTEPGGPGAGSPGR